MPAREIAQFKQQVLGEIENELAMARDDREEAAKQARTAAGFDFPASNDKPYDDLDGAASRLREHRGAIIALERIKDTVLRMSVS